MIDFIGMLACSVRVNYDLSIEDAIKASRHECVGGITSKQFPPTCSGEANLLIKLVQFNLEPSSDYVLAWFDGHRMRAANVHELLALSEFYPHLQMDFRVVELGSIWYYGLSEPMCVKLTSHNEVGQIYLADCCSKWSTKNLFAAVDI